MIRSDANTAWSKWFRIILAALFLLAAIIFVILFDLAALKEFLRLHAVLGPAVCLVAYVFLGATLIPAEPVTFLILAVQGPLSAIALATLGNTLSNMVGFAIGGRIGDLAEFERRRERLPFHLGRLPVHSPAFLFLVRMLPGFGPKFASVAGGVYKVPFFTYLWTTLLANLIGSAFVTLCGMGLIKLIL